MTRRRVGVAVVLVAAGAIAAGVLFVTGSPSTASTSPAGSQLAVREEIAADSGSGRFKPTFVPAGFTLVSDAAEDFPVFQDLTGAQLSTPQHRYGRVLHYSSVSTDQRKRYSSGADVPALNIDVRNIFIAVIPRNVNDKEIAPGNANPVSLRGRGGKQFVPAPNATSVVWSEHPILNVQVTGHGVSTDDVVKVAKGLHEES